MAIRSFVVGGLVALAAGGASAQSLDLGNFTNVATGFSSPLYVANAPGDPTTRLFVVQQGGLIRLVVNGTIQTTPFLNVSALLTPSSGTVTNPVDANGVTRNGTFTRTRGGEQGLLGLAFHPDYNTPGSPNNGVFFINYVAPRNVWSVDTQNARATDIGRTTIAKYRRSAGDQNVADAASADIILQYDQTFTNHNGGCLQFGPDGMLYIASGDGGSGNDPLNDALDPNVLLGKLLRINVNGDDFPADPLRDYSIPTGPATGNPFAGGGGRPEIWARGLRNPWRFSFDSLWRINGDPASGDLYIADVGQDVQEEVNWVPGNGGPGRNYGWRVREGTRNTGLNTGGFDVSNLTPPVYTYVHSPDGPLTGISVTGGYVYRGTAIPGWRGRYFFADFVTNRVWSFRVSGGAVVDFVNHTALGHFSGVSNISSFGEDNAGELYVTQFNGALRRLVPQAQTPALNLADIVQIGGAPGPDGMLTVDDYTTFINAFVDESLLADIVSIGGFPPPDNALTVDDYTSFLNAFAAE